MSSPLLSIVLTLATLGQTQTESTEDKAIHEEQIRFLKEQANTATLFSGADSKTPLLLRAQPVKLYSNSTGFSTVGATFLWVEGDLPVAAVSFSLRRQPKDAVYRECTSLRAAPLECRQGSETVWAPKTGGLLRQRIMNAPVPAESPAQRLTQMRNLARRFNVTWHHSRTDEKTQLRLLTTPLHRYEAQPAGVLDGALFAFVAADDPEMLLVIEAARDATAAASYWRYSLARMSSLKEVVHFDDQEIWSVPNYYQDPNEDRHTGSYNEQRVASFVPASGTPSENPK